MDNRQEDLLSPTELAEYLRTTPAQLAQMRYLGTGPRFCKVGRRVMYRRGDVQAYLDEQTFLSTAGAR